MHIPKSFDLGAHRWEVHHFMALARSALGRVNYVTKSIALATHRLGQRRRKREVAHSFWHETTHAILHDMHHPLRDDEFFVDEFAKRLTQITHTAKL
jgi:hypothetical protein